MRPAEIPKLIEQIFVFLWVFHKLLRPYKFWKGYFPYAPPSCASTDCRENCHFNQPPPTLTRRSVLFFTNSNLFTLIKPLRNGPLKNLTNMPIFIISNFLSFALKGGIPFFSSKSFKSLSAIPLSAFTQLRGSHEIGRAHV